MKKKVIVIIASATLLSICSEYIIIKNKNALEKDNDAIFFKLNQKYNVAKETENSLKKLDSHKKSAVIKDINTRDNVVALCFENIEDMDTLNKILNMLDEYSVKATFIISPKSAAENTEMVKAITRHGHEIGMTALTDENMYNMTQEEIIRNICKSKKIIDSIDNASINLIKCKADNYTDEFLSIAYACGIKYAVESSTYINYQSFKNYEEADGYIKRTKNGSIISIKVNGVLNEDEYFSNKKEKNNLNTGQKLSTKEKSYLKKDISILDTIEWTLQAIALNGKKNIILSSLPQSAGRPADNTDESIQYLNNINVQNNKVTYSTLKNEKVNTDVSDNEIKENVKEIDYNYIISENKKRIVSEIKQFRTTDNTVSYTFRGISDEESLNNVLETLKNMNIKGTFFVTKKEIEDYPDRIKKIISYGNEIGNGGVTVNSSILNKSVSDICTEIYTVDNMLKKIGINTKCYMPGYGYVNDTVREAVSALNNMSGCENYKIITYTKAPIISQYKNADADYIMKKYFNTNTYLSLQKGEIVYFRMDSELFKDKSTVASLVRSVTNNYVTNGYIHRYNTETSSYDLTSAYLGYSVVPVSSQKNTYSIAGENSSYKAENNITTGDSVQINEKENITTDSSVKVKEQESVTTDSAVKVNEQNINEGTDMTGSISDNSNANIVQNGGRTLKERTTKAAEAMYSSNYIGNQYVDLYGFTKEMENDLNKDGLIDTNNESIIFFTFDDWGSDVVVNQIINVLNKHNVHGTFFTIGKYVDINSGISNANPNLLRTIALNGNDVGSHTYNHETANTEKDIFKKSIEKSYSVMYDVIGDTGALKPMFRFPTLATTKDGLDAVFEGGFDYCVSGNISTHDYEASSAQELADNIAKELVPNKGNTVVMHMNNQAYYTAEALDIFLTNNEKGMYGKKYKIMKLSDYLK